MTFLFTKSYRSLGHDNSPDSGKEKQERAQKRLQKDIMQKSILYLAKNRDYDEILYILINKAINIQDWITLSDATSLSAQHIRDVASPVTNNFSDIALVTYKRQSFRSCKLSEGNAFFVHQLQQDSVLHLILKYNPPVEIIDLLIVRLQEYKCLERKESTSNGFSATPLVPEVILDTQGRTPLHVAAAIGSSYDIVLRLVGRGTHQDLSLCPAFLKDSMGRHALHWVCTNPTDDDYSTRSCLSIRTKSEFKSIDNYNLLKIVQLLVQINPGSVVEKDIYEETPVDIAKRHLVKDEIVCFLETAVIWVEQSIREHKKRRDQQINTEENCDTTSELFTCNTSVTTSNKKMTSCYDMRKENSLRSMSPQIPLFMYNNRSMIPRFVGTIEDSNSNYMKHEQQVKSTPYTCPTPSIPSEVYRSKNVVAKVRREEDITSITSTEYVEIEDDVSSIGSGGITTYALPWRPKAFQQI